MAVKLKTVHFEVKTRAVTLPRPVSSADKLYSAASGLLATEIKACAPSPLRLRLMGKGAIPVRGGGGGGGGGIIRPKVILASMLSSDSVQIF